MWAQVNELLFKEYFGTRPITPLHNLCPSKPILTRPMEGWLAKGLRVGHRSRLSRFKSHPGIFSFCFFV